MSDGVGVAGKAVNNGFLKCAVAGALKRLSFPTMITLGGVGKLQYRKNRGLIFFNINFC